MDTPWDTSIDCAECGKGIGRHDNWSCHHDDDNGIYWFHDDCLLARFRRCLNVTMQPAAPASIPVTWKEVGV